MILSDREILDLLRRGEIRFEPEIDLETQLQPCGIDLRLGEDFWIFKTPRFSMIDLEKGARLEEIAEHIKISLGSRFIAHPRDFVIARTLERVEIPRYLGAEIDGRLSLATLGIVIHATAGRIHPGYSGHITLHIRNIGKLPVALYPGMRICKLVFYRMSSEP